MARVGFKAPPELSNGVNSKKLFMVDVAANPAKLVFQKLK